MVDVQQEELAELLTAKTNYAKMTIQFGQLTLNKLLA